MAKIILSWLLGSVIFLAAAGALMYNPVIKPWHMHWGATDAEVQAVLPGDEIVTGNVVQSTRAIAIHAPATKVWTWLVQIGQGRGGWYSYDILENMAGCDIHTLDHIDPDLQNLKVGDIIRLGPQTNLPYYTVIMLRQEDLLVLRSVDPSTGESGETWGFYLVPASDNQTRLVVRHRSNLSEDTIARVINAVFDPVSFVMERKMLRGIRDRAQRTP